MGTCSHQKRMGDEVQSKAAHGAIDQHGTSQKSIGTRISQRTGDPEENALSINLKYNDLTDVMFVDLLPLEENFALSSLILASSWALAASYRCVST